MPQNPISATSWKALIIILTLVFISLFFLYFFYLLGPVSVSGPSRQFVVEKGEGLRQISESLVQGRFIRSATAFKLYSLFTGSAHRLKPGTYELQGSSGTPQIVHILSEGLPQDISVLVVEGATLREIDKLLADLKITSPGDLERFSWTTLREDYPFLQTARDLEGFLFPDTYRFFASSTPETVVRKLLDRFEQQAWPFFEQWEQNSGGEDFYNRLIAASLIEKEVPFTKDRFIVAGIFEKRLTIGMPLQVDSSIVYAKCKGVFKGCPTLTEKDFRLNSPYNTYTRRGLPPTPISSPSVTAIRAALEPESSNFLYYLSDPATKNTIFSKTLEEHAQNRAKYFGPHP
jgi:UPF0755 protein